VSIIEVSGLSKQYRIGTKLPYKTIRETIMNVITSPARLFRGNGSRENNTIWALKDDGRLVYEYHFENKGGKPVPEDFEYNSGTNTWWLTVEELRKMIQNI